MNALLTSVFALLLQQRGTSGSGVIPLLLMVALSLFFIAITWRVFTKAGRAGWKSLIPIYNVLVTLRIVGRPGWWLLLSLIPVVNFIVAVVVSIDLAKSFGKGTGFGLGVAFLGPIFGAILAFGDAEYQGPSAAQSQPSPYARTAH